MSDQPLQFHGIALQYARAILLEAQEQLDIADDAALQGLVQSRTKFAVRQSLEHPRIDEHDAGMIERSDQVLARHEIHSGLAANRGIHLCEHRGWYLHQLDAAHVERGQQSAHVAHHSAAQRDHNGLAVRAQTRQFFG